MARIAYVSKRFGAGTMETIDRANAICAEYQAQGFDLTLRQLYYQFVARGFIPNRQSEYKRLGDVVNDARLAGLMDWDYIVDRTRAMRQNAHWTNPEDIMHSAASGYAVDKWAGQPERVEVWVEKDALVGVVEPASRRNDVPFFACRGYTSQSEMWAAAQRILRHVRRGTKVTILHLGDMTPAGST